MGADPLLSWQTGVQSTREELGMALGPRKAPITGPFLPILAPAEEEGSPGACPPWQEMEGHPGTYQ